MRLTKTRDAQTARTRIESTVAPSYCSGTVTPVTGGRCWNNNVVAICLITGRSPDNRENQRRFAVDLEL